MNDAIGVRQVVQHLRTGGIELVDLPVPRPLENQLLVQTRSTLLSAGTERTLVQFGRAGLIGKALQQPERVRLLVDKLQTDGIAPVLEATLSKLDEPLALGYSNVGVVAEIGPSVCGFKVGQRVVSNAPHATWARVGVNLCALIPETVGDNEAAFVVPASIGLQGIRLAEPTIGETFAVFGVGLIGLLTVQLLSASGCRVIAVDVRPDRLALAAEFGAVPVLSGDGIDVPARALEQTAGREIDGVFIAAATDSNTLVRDAARITRKRGRIILIGVAGLHLNRADFYKKELKFQVSCSYGPGRYDPQYELAGQDYPLPFVRWTEQRNFEAVLQLMVSGRLQATRLISHRYEFARVAEAYETLVSDPNALGILLSYPAPAAEGLVLPPTTIPVTRQHSSRPATSAETGPSVALIGAGAYARRFLMPALKRSRARLTTLVSTGSPQSGWAARRNGFEQISTDPEAAIGSPDINAVIIATRHDSHARYVGEALVQGKHVFVEKPLALTMQELDAIQREYAACIARGDAPIVMVGFNRRFAPLAITMRRLLAQTPGPRCLIYTVNAGALPTDHWTRDAVTGGGRIVGEACHFIDLLRFFIGAPITRVMATPLSYGDDASRADSATITLSFADGSVASVHYFANGARSFPKERIEAFAAGGVLRLDNFRSLSSFSWPGFKGKRLWRQDKGNVAALPHSLTRYAPALPRRWISKS